jgi:hypothetical protein
MLSLNVRARDADPGSLKGGEEEMSYNPSEIKNSIGQTNCLA